MTIRILISPQRRQWVSETDPLPKVPYCRRLAQNQVSAHVEFKADSAFAAFGRGRIC